MSREHVRFHMRALPYSNMDWDKLVENAKQYTDILRRCSLEEVSKWKKEDLDRAFQWAEYFEKVYQKFKQKESLVTRLDSKLREVGREVGVRFGGKELDHSFLADSSLYCCKVLLENPVLPAQLKEMVLAKSPNTLQKHLEEFASDQALLQTLTAMHAKLSENTQVKVNDILHTDAIFILQDLTWLVESSNSPEAFSKRLTQVSQLENGLLALCQTLVLDAPPSGPGRQNQTKEAIIQWLLTHHCEALWKLCPKLLAKISSNFTFFKAYITYLMAEGDKLQQTERLLTVDDARCEVLKCCFVELITTGDEQVKEVCVSLLREKASAAATSQIGLNMWDMILKSVVLIG